jgi:hypothetical protein
MTPEMNKLERELIKTALDHTLTETRYNEILDILLPTMPDIPEGTATLKSLGKKEWIDRRYKRLKVQSAA